ncbi:hypothetical protein B4589_004540 [Halolamina sp. CBA1230]|uniref:uracil-DNA glycosylase family protein n=1 Tax=Halolamina sp. CBA1230 TaxID=1853690 RepID=UPI0009A1DFC1|nr:uracil-DNA glycosylase family protein [Halolamina sp. CBA1230]QKY19681.1 hypothetical protein B4589_004540 [Halolamina sp. CBA1230]
MDDLHEECFEAHVDLVENQWELSARDWWHRYEDDDPDYVDSESDSEFDNQLDKLNFYAFYRCYPARDQEIAVVGTNPKLDPDGPGDDVFDFAEMAEDFEKIQEKSVSTMKEYFTNYSDHPRHAWLGVYKSDEPIDKGGVFRPLATDTDYLDEEEYLNSGIYDDRIYNTIYYTNLFKFGSGDFGELPESDAAAELGEEYLKMELDRVDPEVVIMIGEGVSGLVDSRDLGEIHGTHQKYAGFDVIPHYHPSMYSSNASKEDYQRYRETVLKLLG